LRIKELSEMSGMIENRFVLETNKQAEDSLEFQDLDAFEEDLKRLTPQMIAVLRDTVVPINLADLVSDNASKKESSQ